MGLYSNRSQKTSNCSRADITVINLRLQFSSGKHKNQAFLTFADWRRFVPFSIIACDRGGTDSLIARTTNEPYRLSMSKISAPQSSVWRCSRFGTWCYGVKAGLICLSSSLYFNVSSRMPCSIKGGWINMPKTLNIQM